MYDGVGSLVQIHVVRSEKKMWKYFFCRQEGCVSDLCTCISLHIVLAGGNSPSRITNNIRRDVPCPILRRKSSAGVDHLRLPLWKTQLKPVKQEWKVDPVHSHFF